MGFGICLIANALFLFEIYGLETASFALFGYAFALLSETDKRFFPGVYVSAMGLIPAVIRLLNIFDVIHVEKYDPTGLLLQSASAALLIAVYAILFAGVKRIAEDSKAKKLAAQCVNAVRISSLTLSFFIISSILFNLFATTWSPAGQIMGIAIAAKYITIALMTVYIYFCYVSVSTPKLIRKEQKADTALAEKERRIKEKD